MQNRKHNRGRRGNAILEFALAFSFLFPLFTGTFQFGYAFFLYNRLHNAVRAGARYASLETYASGTSTPPDAFSNAVKNLVVYGDVAGGTNPVVTGLTTANVELTVLYVNGTPGNMQVRLTNYTLDAFFGIFHLNTPVAVFSYVGRYSPP
jgi:Flp pilus assembly protein TadG